MSSLRHLGTANPRDVTVLSESAISREVERESGSTLRSVDIASLNTLISRFCTRFFLTLLTGYKGGANGIGAATTQLLYEQGANIVFGDLDRVAGNKLVRQLTSDSSPRVHFVKTDVTDYQSVLELFAFAFEKYGRIDHALPFAGIVEIGNWFDPSLDLASIKKVIHAIENGPPIGMVLTS